VAARSTAPIGGSAEAEVVRDISIDSIDIANPRDRNQKNFREIVEPIRALGLKKPITVRPRHNGEEERYLLICGQGRVEAFRALGQSSMLYSPFREK
jgi:ParB family transcriptional regulator, chromosome partitioning protein